MKVTKQEAYQAALSAGFNKAEAVLMVATGMVENSLDLSTSTGNRGGLFQFEPSTWGSATCDKGSLSCQMSVARKITSGSFITSWYQNWYRWENKQNPQVTPQYYAQLVGGIESSLGIQSTGAVALIGEATNTVNSGSAFGGLPDPGGIAGGISNGVSSVIGIPGKLVGAAAGDIGSAIGSGIAGGLKNVGQHLLPYILIVGGMAIVGVLFFNELKRKELSPPSAPSVQPANTPKPFARADGSPTANIREAAIT